MFSLQVKLLQIAIFRQFDAIHSIYSKCLIICISYRYSEAEPKGSDCYDQFATMQECFAKYPTVYNKAGSPEDDDYDESKDVTDPTNLLATQSNVDTVDQLEETDKTSSAKNDKSTESTSKK